MKVAVFSTKYYEKEYLDQANSNQKHKITYFEDSLNFKNVNLAKDFEVVSVMLLDEITKDTIEALSKQGIKLIALRSAGFDNVDLKAAKENNIKVVIVRPSSKG